MAAAGKERHRGRGKGRPCMSLCRYACGFTLIEVAIVIFIIVMMTSVTVPRMKTFAESTRLRSTARSIRSLMEFARSSSVAQRTEYVVMFDSQQGKYWLSLLELMDQESGSSVTDVPRTSISSFGTPMSASLPSLSVPVEDSDDLMEEEAEQIEGAYSRTGGILDIPKPLPASVSIAQISSPRTATTRNADGTEYIAFRPDGTAEDFEIYLQSLSGKVLLLSVAQATGRAAIQELTVEEIEELDLELSE